MFKYPLMQNCNEERQLNKFNIIDLSVIINNYYYFFVILKSLSTSHNFNI